MLRVRPSADSAEDAHAWIEAALQSTQIAFGVVSLYENRYVRANAAMAAMLGTTLDELFSVDPFSLALRVTHPDELAQEQQQVGEVASGQRSFYELEKRYRQPDGSVRWGRLTFCGVYDPAPNSGVAAVPVKYVVLQIVDITRERELRETLAKHDADALHAQKVEGLGRLAAGVAHDFNNLLTVITGHGEVLRSQLDASTHNELAAQLADDVAAILAAAERAAALTAQLLAHGRRERVVPRRFVLSDLVGTLNRLLVRTMGSNIQVEQALAARGAIWADQGQIGQVVMNLMLNARDAITDGGRIVLSTRDLKIEAGEQSAMPGPGEWVALSVADDGHGMSLEIQERMFEPFFTTRSERPGTQGNGLGLSTVQRIVREANGKLDVDSAPGRGTTVSVYFPRVEAGPQDPPPDRRRVQKAEPNSRRVLVIEDEPAVRSLIATLLIGAHYLVMVARDGEEGLRLLDAEPTPVHLIITDLVMPRMTGLALARALATRQQRPRLLFVSGYSSSTPAEIAPYGELLPKPFTPAQLLDAVAQALSDE